MSEHNPVTSCQPGRGMAVRDSGEFQSLLQNGRMRWAQKQLQALEKHMKSAPA
jgi:hypothetical protein